MFTRHSPGVQVVLPVVPDVPADGPQSTSCVSPERSSGEGSFNHKGVVTVSGCDYPITVMRDTAAQVSVLKNPTGRPLVSKEFIKIKGIVEDTFCPLVVVHLQCPVVTVTAEVAIVDSLPVDGVDFLLGNDLAGGKVFPSPPPPVVMAEECYPVSGVIENQTEMEDLYPMCAVTLSMSRLAENESDGEVEQSLSPDPVNEDTGVGGFCVPEVTGVEALRQVSPSGGASPDADVEGSSEVCKSHQEGADCNEPGLPNSDVVVPRVEDEDTVEEGEVSPDSPGPELPRLLGSADSPLEMVSSPTSGDDTQVVPVAPELSEEDEVAELPFSDSPTLPIDTSSFEQSQIKDLASVSSTEFAKLQVEDATLKPIFARVTTGTRKSGMEEEFQINNGILYRNWTPKGVESENMGVTQLVVPSCYRTALIQLAHEGPLAGHLGIHKTSHRLLRCFWWPGLRVSVGVWIKTCHTCQVIGKPTHSAPPVPLHPIPAFDPPFTRVMIDVVGPLPPTSSGNKYLLTLMDVSTRYPEAIPMRSIHAKVVLKVLLKFFTVFGMPKELQSDRGVNFTSNIFESMMKEWGIHHVVSSAYHPQSQGALERHHQTLKNMLRSFCLDHDKDWDQAVPYVLFAVREVPTDSLGFSPNDLVFGHRVRGPLDVIRDGWAKFDPMPTDMLKFLEVSRERLHEARRLAGENLKVAQGKMKEWYDRRAAVRSLEVGDEVLALLPVQGKPLAARYSGPYEIVKQVGELDFLIKTPDRRKPTQLCHINMLKKYIRPDKPCDMVKAGVAVAVVDRSRENNADKMKCVRKGPVVPVKSCANKECVDRVRADPVVLADEEEKEERSLR